MIIRPVHHFIFWLTISICLGGYASLQRIAFPLMQEAESPLIINELMASNGDGLTDEDGDLVDWIELYNRSEQTVDLSEWALTDDSNWPNKWSFPARTLPPQSYLIVFASGKNRGSTDPNLPLHSNFKLAKNGEYLSLMHQTDQALHDTLGPLLPRQWRYIAYGRYGPDQTFAYSPQATPGQPNTVDVVWPGVMPPVQFSQQRGLYQQPITLNLSSPDSEAIIRFTTDGSKPTETTGQLYQQPLIITNTTVVRAASFKPGYLTAEVTTHTYLFLDDVVTQVGMRADLTRDPAHLNQVKTALKTIPSLSLVSPDDSFYIYAHAWQKGREWERPVSVELIPPPVLAAGPAEPGFQVDAGMRMNGKGGRSLNKISFRLFFRGIYGPTKLHYPLFPESPVQSFETLILRAGGNRNFTNDRMTTPFLQDSTYGRDQWFRDSQIAMSGYGSHGRFVHLYLNGHYWGLYNLVERPDAAMAASYLGGTEADWYTLKPDGSSQGDDAPYQKVQALVQSGLAAQASHYSQLQQYLDTTAFADYMILHWYAGAQDWPHSNWYLNGRVADGQLRYFAWDGEETWTGMGADVHLDEEYPSFIGTLFRALIQNPEFQVELADRLYHHLQAGGALSDAASQARWHQIHQPLEKAISAEIARWGLIRHQPAEPESWLQQPDQFLTQIAQASNRWADRRADDVALTYEDWQQAQTRVAAEMAGNGDRLIALARQHGYYPPLNPPTIQPPRHTEETPFQLELEAANQPDPALTGATIYYTINGQDPRRPLHGTANPTAQVYQGSLKLPSGTVVKARTYYNGQWSALAEVSLGNAIAPAPLQTQAPNQMASQIIFSEIMYNPPEGNDHEFITLKNIGETPVDLSSAYFEGIRYQFSNPYFLEGGGSFTLVSNPAAVISRYPNLTIDGVYQGKLSNQGETITLKGSGERTLFSVSYDDDNGWPLTPDGRGDLLRFTHDHSDPNLPENWQAGTP